MTSDTPENMMAMATIVSKIAGLTADNVASVIGTVRSAMFGGTIIAGTAVPAIETAPAMTAAGAPGAPEGSNWRTAKLDGKVPAVQVARSVTHEHIYCLDDGKPYSVLKRRIKSLGYEGPEHYRFYWGLPGDYPMVATSHSQKRSAIAKGLGFGRRRTTTAPKAVEPKAATTTRRRRAAPAAPANTAGAAA